MRKDLSGKLDKCPRCGYDWKSTLSMIGEKSTFWKECSNPSCNSFYNTYIPQPHQRDFHLDDHTYVGNFGGYGSGKTLTSIEESYKHWVITPDGNTLIGANVTSQYEMTIKRDIEKDLPIAFVKRNNTQKSYVDLINGHRIMYRPFDDPDKLRSYNLTSFVILEASEVKREAFIQLRTRLRNTACAVFDLDEDGKIVYKLADDGITELPVILDTWGKGIIESNPAQAWIKKDILLDSEKIYVHGEVHDSYVQDETSLNPYMSTHVTSTSANAYLPPDYIEQAISNRPPWWVARYIYGSFIHSEGRVYPNAEKTFTRDSFEIPVAWKRAVAHDHGISDPSIFLFSAIDKPNNTVYVYDEVDTSEKSIEQLAKIYKKASEDIPIGGYAFPPKMDPKSGWKRDAKLDQVVDLYAQQGIYFEPGAISVDARVLRTNTYIESGKLVIFRDRCPRLCAELEEYKFKEDADSYSGYTDKPVDKKNHSINCLEWICMALPANPMDIQFGIYDQSGNDITDPQLQALEDDKMRRTHAMSDVDPVDYITPTESVGYEKNTGYGVELW